MHIERGKSSGEKQYPSVLDIFLLLFFVSLILTQNSLRTTQRSTLRSFFHSACGTEHGMARIHDGTVERKKNWAQRKKRDEEGNKGINERIRMPLSMLFLNKKIVAQPVNACNNQVYSLCEEMEEMVFCQRRIKKLDRATCLLACLCFLLWSGNIIRQSSVWFLLVPRMNDRLKCQDTRAIKYDSISMILGCRESRPPYEPSLRSNYS